MEGAVRMSTGSCTWLWGLHLQRHDSDRVRHQTLSLSRQQHKALDVGDNGSMVEVMSPADVATEIISATSRLVTQH